MSITHRYAKAFADVVTKNNEANVALTNLKSFQSLLGGHHELQGVFYNPTIPIAQKQGVLKALLEKIKPSTTVANFLTLLLENQRIQQLALIITAFERELDLRLGLVSAEVTTAAALADAERQKLKDSVAKMTGKDVRLQFKTDADIIGGVVTRIGSVVYDGSIRNQLQQIKARLAQE